MKTRKYVCEACGAVGVKLWREGATSCIELKCKACATKEQAKQIAQYAHFHREDSDQIGNLLPAVPDEFPGPDGALPKSVGFWGYTSVPQTWCAWWDGLPDKMGDARKTVVVDWARFEFELWTWFKDTTLGSSSPEHRTLYELVRRWRKGTPP